MQGKLIQANATRKNLAELLLQPKSLCHKYRTAASRRWRLNRMHWRPSTIEQMRQHSRKNTSDGVKLLPMKNRLQQVLPAFKCQSRQFLLLANTKEIHSLWSQVSYQFFVMSQNNFFFVLIELIYTLFSNHYKNQSLHY